MTANANQIFSSFLLNMGMAAFIGIFLYSRSSKGNKAGIAVAVIALATAAIGLGMKVMLYGHPERLLNILARPTSRFSLDLILSALCVIILLMYIVRMGKNGKIFLMLGLLCSVAGIWINGSAWMLPSRAAWNTFLVPLLFIATSLSAGAAISGIFYNLTGEAGAKTWRFAGVFAVVSVTIVLLYALYLSGSPAPHPTRSASRFLTGDLRAMSWGAIGLLMAVAFLAKAGDLCNNRYIASLLNIAGAAAAVYAGFLLRMAIFAMGTSVQQF